jgi:hypothetical protein
MWTTMICMEQLYIATPHLRNANWNCKPKVDVALAMPLLEYNMDDGPELPILVGAFQG